jgi:hypothetical protein
LEDLENDINPLFENLLRIEKIIDKYPAILKPKSFDTLSSFGEMLSYLIYDVGCHFGLIKYNNNNVRIKNENRLFFLGEKKKFYSNKKP